MSDTDKNIPSENIENDLDKQEQELERQVKEAKIAALKKQLEQYKTQILEPEKMIDKGMSPAVIEDKAEVQLKKELSINEKIDKIYEEIKNKNISLGKTYRPSWIEQTIYTLKKFGSSNEEILNFLENSEDLVNNLSN